MKANEGTISRMRGVKGQIPKSSKQEIPTAKKVRVEDIFKNPKGWMGPKKK